VHTDDSRSRVDVIPNLIFDDPPVQIMIDENASGFRFTEEAMRVLESTQR
jgi:hypothetical protein